MTLSSLFHPAVAAWFAERFASPTAAQMQAWPAIQAGRHTLIAAPTGSGKTLAAFLAAIDGLLRQGLEGRLADATQVVYVSPLKALSNDIQRNLEAPLAGISQALCERALPGVEIRTSVRTGDTPPGERQRMLRRPPHIVVTTPESLYILLGSASGRAMLATTRTVIVDEIHAMAPNKRGAHLALSLERLDALCGGKLQRIGLSATQNPIQAIAHLLVGAGAENLATARMSEAVTVAGAAVDDAGCAADRAAAAAGDTQAAAHDTPAAEVTIVDTGHQRPRDLAIEVPESPLEAVMSAEVWTQVYDRLVRLVEAHRTTLVFVNTRRMAERVARQLSDRLGEASVTAHHGSMAKEHRLEAEQRLKRGELKALVATASLELGIDIGDVDLVCQLGSPRSIASFLQRVGRSGHAVGGTPKGRLFPLSRDDLVECAALLDSVRRGELDRISLPRQPLDVLAQQIVAEVSAQDWPEAALFDLMRRAWPYRSLSRDDFTAVVHMLAEGFSTRRGRRGALLHHDAVNHMLRGRRGARLTALTSGGTIPDNADYQVLLEPENQAIGSVNEDFAVESLAGDVFQLGNNAYRIMRVERGVVRVEDARGQAPTIPFWLGEAPGRSDELSASVSRLRAEIAQRLQRSSSAMARAARSHRRQARQDATKETPPPLEGGGWGEGCVQPPISAVRTPPPSPLPQGEGECLVTGGRDTTKALHWLTHDIGIAAPATEQLIEYLSGAFAALGTLPTHDTLVLERFFDEAGGMQLVLHSPFGSRINRAWGLALRKRFCRKFNFELQAAATEDNIVLSLTTAHSFELAEVARYLHSASVRTLLTEALLDAPMFITRWRWVAGVALALPRFRGGRKVPPQLARMDAEDLIAAVFPDQIACAENLVGAREIPDHPLTNQTIADCLHEAMDVAGLERLLARLESGDIRVVACDVTQPSPLALEVLSARPYAFLDDAPLEERRTQAVMGRRWLDPESSGDLGRLDPEAIARVRNEAWPDPANAEELHDALLWLGCVSAEEAQAPEWTGWLATLARDNRVTLLCGQHATIDRSNAPAPTLWVAAERLAQFQALWPEAQRVPAISPPADQPLRTWTREEALAEILRGRLEGLGPVTQAALAAPLGLAPDEIGSALVALEVEGFAMRGHFTPRSDADPGSPDQVRGLSGAGEWCDRRLLARIHHYTVRRLRAEIEPVAARDFLRFLFGWQRLTEATRLEGPDAVTASVALLEGFEAPAGAWETELLPARIAGYEPTWLDDQCLAGRVAWARLSPCPARADNNADHRRGDNADHRRGDNADHRRGGSADHREGGNSGRRSGSHVARREHAATPVRTTPITLLPRRHVAFWTSLSGPPEDVQPSGRAQAVLHALRSYGASFFEELAEGTGLLRPQVEDALGELVALGLVSSDSFGGLRALLVPSERRKSFTGITRRRRTLTFGMEDAGRWALTRRAPPDTNAPQAAGAIEHVARTLLRRYGVVFWRLLAREADWLPPWRDLLRVYRRLEARGEIRGGRFVAGFSGEQFALPEAIGALREARRQPASGEWVSLSGADPLNLAGILTPGPRLAALTANRLLFRDGLPVAWLAGGEVRFLETLDPASQWEARKSLLRSATPTALADLA